MKNSKESQGTVSQGGKVKFVALLTCVLSFIWAPALGQTVRLPAGAEGATSGEGNALWLEAQFAFRSGETEKTISTAIAACDAGTFIGCSLAGELLISNAENAEDVVKAVSLFGRGCEGGNANACQGFGLARIQGVGGRADQLQGRTALQKACDLGNAMGCNNFGTMTMSGLLGTPDLALAKVLFRRALQLAPEDPIAREGLANLSEQQRNTSPRSQPEWVMPTPSSFVPPQPTSARTLNTDLSGSTAPAEISSQQSSNATIPNSDNLVSSKTLGTTPLKSVVTIGDRTTQFLPAQCQQAALRTIADVSVHHTYMTLANALSLTLVAATTRRQPFPSAHTQSVTNQDAYLSNCYEQFESEISEINGKIWRLSPPSWDATAYAVATTGLGAHAGTREISIFAMLPGSSSWPTTTLIPRRTATLRTVIFDCATLRAEVSLHLQQTENSAWIIGDPKQLASEHHTDSQRFLEIMQSLACRTTRSKATAPQAAASTVSLAQALQALNIALASSKPNP